MALLGATAVCVAFCQGRERLWAVNWLPWMMLNLGLAWIPYLLALLLEGVLCTLTADAAVHPSPLISKRRRTGYGVVLGLAAIWLAFLPNAAYLVTDMAHWQPVKGMPAWCDLVYMFSLAWTGLALSYGAIHGLHEWISERWGFRVGWSFALSALALSTAGVYVGRFWRWNSWEVMTRPSMLAADLARLGDGAVAQRAATFCGAFFVLCVMNYGVLHTLHRSAVSPGLAPEGSAP